MRALFPFVGIFMLGLVACRPKERPENLTFRNLTDSLVKLPLHLETDPLFQIIQPSWDNLDEKGDLDYYHWYSLKSWKHRKDQQHDSAIVYNDSMLYVLRNQVNVNDYYMYALLSKGNSLRALGLYDESLKELFAANLFLEGAKALCEESSVFQNIANNFFSKEEYGQAIYYYKRAIDNVDNCKDNHWRLNLYVHNSCLNAMGFCYERIDQYDSARIFYQQSLNLLAEKKKELKEPEIQFFIDRAKGVTLGNLAYTETLAGNYDQAEDYFNQSIAANGPYPVMKEDVLLTRIKRGNMWLKRGNLEETAAIIKSAEDTLKDLNSSTGIIRLNRLKRDYYTKKGEIDKAYQAFILIDQVEDSLQERMRQPLNLGASTTYSLISERSELQKLKQVSEKRNLLLLAGLLIVLVLFIVVVFIRRSLIASKKHVAALDKLNREIFKQHDDLDNAMKALERSNEENKKLMKVLAHDLRSPMGAIISLAGILEEMGPLNEEQKSSVAMMVNLGNDSLAFMEDLLQVRDKDFDKIKTKIDLLELLEYCATFMRFKAEEKQQNIEVSGEIIPALVNRDQIWRVVNNLLNNAIKFSPLGTTIYVKVHKEGKEAIVSIKDQGIGMPEDMKDKVFNMFAGAGRSGTSGEKTFGLGLPICKQIMDAHKGKIWFESKEGKGSTFFLSFPL